MTQSQVLIVEDDESLREALCDTVKLAGYDVIAASNGNVALDVLRNQDVSIIITDVQMDGMDGHTLLKRAKVQHADVPVVLMTAYGTIQKAVEAMQDGAIDYLVKPFEPEVLVNVLSRYITPESSEAVELIAEDPLTKDVLNLVNRVSESDATVLISGESGSGKEVFARAIHRASSRRDAPFIAINCAAIPENMLEAMLFGYEKGAFTGAYKSSPGKFELANGGTLLLDEISEMDMGLQAKLLRVLQEREVERLGGNTLIPLDVRVLATTNREMKKEVAVGRFREDLYYRLNVFPVHLPALRERPLDIVPLFSHLLSRHISGKGKPVPEISEEAKKLLVAHSWPGNVRELDNVAQRALILQSDNIIEAEHILFEPDVIGSTTQHIVEEISLDESDAETLGENIRQKEHQVILDVLKACDGSRKIAADKLGISQRTLRYKLARMREDGLSIPA